MSVHLRSAMIVSASLAGLLAGCATVDPQPDYARASAFIAQATGIPDAHDPGGAEAVEQRVKELQEGGLTADEAAELALLNNDELLAAFLDIGIARADLVQSGLLSNPKLAMAFRFPSGGGLTAIDLDVGQNIADFWQIPARRRAAEGNLEATVLRIAHQASALAATANASHSAARGADQRLAIARENLELTRSTLELIEFTREAGSGSALDVNLARGVVLAAELSVQRAQLAAGQSRRDLAALLGLRTDASHLVLVEGPKPVLGALVREELVTTALTHRLDVRALRQAVRAAEERLVLERRRVFPSLEVGLTYERDSRSAADERDPDFTAGPGIALELPVFDQNQAQIARAQYLLEQGVHRLRALETAIVHEVGGAADQVQTTREILRLYEQEVLPQSRRNLELAGEAYRAGKTGTLAVLDAERTYLAARDRQAAARQEAAITLVQLERVVGLPLEEIVEPQPRRPHGCRER